MSKFSNNFCSKSPFKKEGIIEWFKNRKLRKADKRNQKNNRCIPGRYSRCSQNKPAKTWLQATNYK